MGIHSCGNNMVLVDRAPCRSIGPTASAHVGRSQRLAVAGDPKIYTEGSGQYTPEV